MDRQGSDGLRLDDQLCFALYAATGAITRRYRAGLSEIGLTYPQYLVMLTLWQDGPSTIGQVARRLGLDSHAVTPLARRLEAGGLVTRRRGDDRRTVHLELTARGRELESAAAHVQARVACATGLAPDELAELRLSLHALSEHLAAATPSPAPEPAPSGRSPADPATTPEGAAS